MNRSAQSITSFEWVNGIRFPSSSMREPLSVSISSSTRTFTRWWTLASSPSRGTRKASAFGWARLPAKP